MIKINELGLLDIASTSTLSDENTKYIYESIDYVLKNRLNVILKKFFLDLDNLTEKEIDFLLWEYHVDYVDSNISLSEKVELVRNAVVNHFNKGTLGSINNISKILFGNSEISEWFDYGGNAGYFRINTTGTLTNENDYNRVLEVVNEYKNTRSWLEKIAFTRSYQIGEYTDIILEKQITNILNERDFELPWYDNKLNTDVISVVLKENNIGMKG